MSCMFPSYLKQGILLLSQKAHDLHDLLKQVKKKQRDVRAIPFEILRGAEWKPKIGMIKNSPQYMDGAFPSRTDLGNERNPSLDSLNSFV